MNFMEVISSEDAFLMLVMVFSLVGFVGFDFNSPLNYIFVALSFVGIVISYELVCWANTRSKLINADKAFKIELGEL